MGTMELLCRLVYLTRNNPADNYYYRLLPGTD